MHCWNLSLIVVSCLCFISGAPAQEPHAPPPPKVEMNVPEVSLPLHWSRRNPVVDVKINGQGPFRFFLDTGAQGSVLGLDLAEELHLPVLGEARVGSPGGKGLPAKRVRLDRVDVGEAVLTGVTAMAFDRSSISGGKDNPRGVLSAKSFPGYLLTVNYPKERLVIRPGELPVADGDTVFAYDPKLPLPELRINVAGQETTLHMDTGAPSGITLPLEFAERLPLESKPVEIGRGRRVDQEVIIYGAKLKGDVKVGKFVLHSPDLRFQNIPGAKGNIGGEFLRKFAVTLDSKNCRIRLEEVAPPGQGSGQQ
jgi:predicted aspartyl protease